MSFLDTNSIKFNVWVVYHPPPSSKTPGNVADLYAELENLFYDASLSATPTVVLGDFNMHYDDAKQSEPLRMLLRSFNLIQHVDVATHQCGHTLDLVITHDDEDLLSSVTVTPDSLSDHHRVEVKLNAYIPPPRTSTICRRSFKRTDINALAGDITAACAAMCECTAVTGHSAEQLTSRYDARLVECLDKHAPLRKIRICTNNSPNPWYDDDIEEARLKRKTCEKTWRHSKLEIHRQIYVAARNGCTSLIFKKKTEYYRDKLEHACNKTMFDLVKTLSGQQHQRQQPNFRKTDKGCDMFSEYFKNQTAKLVIDMQCQSGSLRHQFQETPLFTHTLNYFTEMTDCGHHSPN